MRRPGPVLRGAPRHADVSVVVPTLNEERHLPLLLDSLAAQTVGVREVLVVDAGSTDATREVAEAAGALFVPGGGLPGISRNIGAGRATSTWLLFLDADVRLPPRAVETIVAEVDRRRLDAASTAFVPDGRGLGVRLQHWLSKEYFWATSAVGWPHSIGAFLFVRRALHLEIGGFDQAIMVAEDQDYVLRLHRAGRYAFSRRPVVEIATRRFDEEGLLKMSAKWLGIEAHRLLLGEIRSDRFHYFDQGTAHRAGGGPSAGAFGAGPGPGPGRGAPADFTAACPSGTLCRAGPSGPTPDPRRDRRAIPESSRQTPMSETRTERDSLGEIQVPASARYAAQTQRAVENFPISGQRFGRRFIQALGLVKQSAAEVNGAAGDVDEAVADAVARAAAEVAAGDHDGEFVVDVYQTGSGTSTNMNTNEVVANRATELLGGEPRVHPNDHVNFGQSSNDVIPTAMHVSARIALAEELIPALDHLARALEHKARDFDHVVKSGRTHLMDATPVRLGQEFGGWAAQVRKAVARLEAVAPELEELALGGTATGTGINTRVGFAADTIARLAEKTGFAFREADNHFEAQGAKDAVVNVSGVLNTVAVSLMKIADDVRWLSSGPTSGIHEIRLPAIQPGSSIMPGKVNPVMSEALMMVCARVMGNHTTVTVGGQRGNFELNVMMPVMAQALLESLHILAGAARAFTDHCVVGIEANEPRCRELLEKNPSIATALNPTIGYDKAAEVAKKAAKEGRSVRDVVREMGFMDDDDLDAALDVRSMTQPGLPE